MEDTSGLTDEEYLRRFTKPTWRMRFRIRRLICRMRGHKTRTDGDGYLFCLVCYQSLTSEGEALGYREDSSQ